MPIITKKSKPEADNEYKFPLFRWDEDETEQLRWINPFLLLPDDEQDARLMKAADRAIEDMSKPPLQPTGLGREMLFRDMTSKLFLLGGAKPEEVDFLFCSKPDGSHIAGLGRVVSKMFESGSPANRLAYDTNLVERIVEDCASLGIVGERNLVLAIYLIGTSRLLDRPLSGIVQGRSSSGKSFLVEGVSKLFPDDAVIHATRISPDVDGGPKLRRGGSVVAV